MTESRSHRRHPAPGSGEQPDPPRLLERPHDCALLTRDEVADMLGYSRTSMATIMNRDPGRWPRPAALLRRGRVWVMLWDRAEILAAAPPADATIRTGSVATISDGDGLIPCLECGRRYRSLGRHLHAAHDLTAAEYRQAHRLPATGALNSDGARQATSERQRARFAEDPDVFAHLRPWNTPEHLAAMQQRGAEEIRRTSDYDTVRAHQAPGRRYAVQTMLANRRHKLDEQAQAHGYESMHDAIRRTQDLPARQAARLIGAGASTVARWRRRTGEHHAPGAPRGSSDRPPPDG